MQRGAKVEHTVGLSEKRWRERGIMDYELRIIVEKVAISSQEVIKRDTITEA